MANMESAYPELIWRQTSPGVWQRSIDEIEESYSALAALYEGSGLMFFAITGHVSLTIDTASSSPVEDADAAVDQALQKAWLALRHDHPTIASQVTEDLTTGKWTKTYRQFGDENDKASWLRETLVPLATGKTGVEWANSNPPAPKVPTLFVHNLPSGRDGAVRRDLVLRSPHDIVDGIGTLMLLNNLIAHASKAYAEGAAYKLPTLDGSEAANLSPPYRVAAKVPPVLNDAQKKRLADNSAKSGAAMQEAGVEVIDMPYRRGAQLPSRHQRVALTLSPEQTTKLVAACKAAGATVTHAFHAAGALVVRDIQPSESRGPETKRVRYVNYILRNERSVCQPPYNTPKHPAALYHSVPSQSLVVDMTLAPVAGQDDGSKEEFQRVVAIMRDFYHGVRNDAEHYALAPAIWAAGTPRLPLGQPRPLPVPPPKVHPSVSISSMGRVDGIISPRTGSFEAYNPWVTGEELCNGLGLFLGSFRGELTLSAAYNDAWHTEQDVLDFLRRCQEVVFRGFDI